MAELDSATGDHPAYLAADSFHSGAANSKAFALLAPPDSLSGVERDPSSGQPTGAFLTDDAHFFAARKSYAQLSDTRIEELIRGAAEQIVSKGVTTLHCLDGQFVDGDRDIDAFLRLDGHLPVHTVLMYQTMDVKRVLELGLPRIGGCLTIDGAGFERTALFYQPYADAPGDLWRPLHLRRAGQVLRHGGAHRRSADRHARHR